MTEPKQPYRIKDRPPTIFRVVKSKDNPYVMIDRRPIENPKLSFKAKGILTYALSRPDGWEFNLADLKNHCTDGRDSIRAGLTELRAAGHLEYQQERESGKFGTGHILVYEVPLTEPQTDFPLTDKPLTENPTQVLSTLSNKDIKQKNDEDEERTAEIGKVYKTYQSEIGVITPMIADSIDGWIKDGFPLKWLCDAFQESSAQGKRSWKYCEAIIKRWDSQGSQEAIKKDIPKFQRPNTATNNDEAIRSVLNAIR